jgi:large subunit ribosomal protein L28
MSRRCVVCGKGPQSGNLISHSERKSKRKWLPNLRMVRVVINGTHRRVRVCSKCLKAGKVKKAA